MELFHYFQKTKYLILLFWLTGNCFAQSDLETQRSAFLAARNAISSGDVEHYSNTAHRLKDYPLYPYLRYYYLKSRLNTIASQEIREFLEKYPDTPLNERVRVPWLTQLAKHQQWQIFLDNYTPQTDVTLRCNYLQARINTHRMEWVLQDAKELWLVGKPQPTECNSAFELLMKSDLMTNELLWQRIRLAMKEGQTSLAQAVGAHLPIADQSWLKLWLQMHAEPSKTLVRAELQQDTPMTREIITHGLIRIAQKEPFHAQDLWAQIKGKYEFSEAMVGEILRTIALTGFKNNLGSTLEWLDAVPNSAVDEEVQHARIVTAITHKNWEVLKRWTQQEPASPKNALRWHYWKARALEATGNSKAAQEVYKTLAQERDYYGFSAADRLGIGYQMQHQPIRYSEQEELAFMRIPGIIRAQELRQVGLGYEARSEWTYTINTLDEHKKLLSAVIANRWGWHDRAIITLKDLNALHDLDIRFPMPYQNYVENYAQIRQVEASTLLGLMRAESAFMADARSPTGALGLMQLMPATAREVAHREGLKLSSSNDLLMPEKNIMLGSSYIRQMLQRYDGNLVMAAAAYNAGPGRVESWRPRKDCEPGDLWIEKIPFTETRLYVQKILFYSTVYEWKLGKRVQPISTKVKPIPSKEISKSGNLYTCKFNETLVNG